MRLTPETREFVGKKSLELGCRVDSAITRSVGRSQNSYMAHQYRLAALRLAASLGPGSLDDELQLLRLALAQRYSCTSSPQRLEEFRIVPLIVLDGRNRDGEVLARPDRLDGEQAGLIRPSRADRPE